MSKPQNLHYAFELAGGKDNKALTARVKDYLLPNLNETDFSFEGTTGLSTDSLRVLDILSGSKDGKATAGNFLQKIGKQGVQTGDKYAFVSTFADGKQLSALTLNYFTVQMLQRLGGLDNLSSEQRVGLRNYFTQQAAVSAKPCCVVKALRGLRALGDIPAVRLGANQKKQVALKDKAVTFEIVSSFGQALKAQTLSKVSLADLSDNKAGLKDVTTQVKLDGAVATWNAESAKIGRYQLVITFGNGFTVSSPAVTVADKVTVTSVQYSVEKSLIFPTTFNGKVDFPNKPANIKQLTDDTYLHLSVQAGFLKSNSERPAQVYAALKKKSSTGGQNVAVTSYGKLNKDSGLYEITFSANKDIAVHLNGDYELSVHVADYRAETSLVYNLGDIKIWYKEGLDEGSNGGVRDEYKPLPVINFIYPPEKPQISLLVRHRPLILIVPCRGCCRARDCVPPVLPVSLCESR